MWGSGNNQQSNEMSPINIASPSNTRSPCQTPKLSLFNNQQNAHHEKCNKPLDNSHHIKWNGNAAVNSGKEVISIFPIHNNDVYSQSASANPVESHHTNHHLHRHSSEITSEVWPYSYPYAFSYAQHQASTQ